MDQRFINNLSRLFLSHERLLVHRAAQILRSPTDAEDIVQDVMLAVLSAPSMLAGVERVRGWLLTLVHRRCVDFLRRKVGRRKVETVAGENISWIPDSPDIKVEEKELEAAFTEAVEDLPENLQTVFMANAVENKPFRVISEETGIPMGTLMARKQKASRLVRARLNKKGYEF